MSSVKSVVISCAGIGSRLGLGLTKALVQINGRSLISWQLELFKDVEDIRIVIGDNVAIAFGCTFVNSSHVLGDKECRAGKSIADKIIVEDGCWIGANSTIMPGVRISKGCVIGSNSLILQDTEPNCLYVGQPARKVKELFV